MFYVYFLKSIKHPDKIYVGYTDNVTQRLIAHNQGKSMYTAKYAPWNLHGYIAFKKESRAIVFEKYLKSGAGKAFANKHFL
jgi:predicted GIY-YIG superfamily endonuclease